MRRRKPTRADSQLEGVAERLRQERPEAGPHELDRVKTAAMSRASTPKPGRRATSRLAVAGLTVGMLAATTGGVIASQGAGHSAGNAAVAQYGNNCDTNNGNGAGSGDNSNNFNCNENSFNGGNTTTINNYAAPVTNNYTTVSATPAVSVLGTKTTKAATSKRKIRIHVKVPRGSKLSRVTVRINGKRLKTLTGKKASANIELVNLPCSKGATTIEVSVTLSTGKTVTARHQYHLCT